MAVQGGPIPATYRVGIADSLFLLLNMFIGLQHINNLAMPVKVHKSLRIFRPVAVSMVYMRFIQGGIRLLSLTNEYITIVIELLVYSSIFYSYRTTSILLVYSIRLGPTEHLINPCTWFEGGSELLTRGPYHFSTSLSSAPPVSQQC